jgi:hypothetical protein
MKRNLKNNDNDNWTAPEEWFEKRGPETMGR